MIIEATALGELKCNRMLPTPQHKNTPKSELEIDKKRANKNRLKS